MKTSGVGNLKRSIQQKKNGGMRMTMEEYKELIFLLVQSIILLQYIHLQCLIRIRREKRNKKCGNDRFDHLHIFCIKLFICCIVQSI